MPDSGISNGAHNAQRVCMSQSMIAIVLLMHGHAASLVTGVTNRLSPWQIRPRRLRASLIWYRQNVLRQTNGPKQFAFSYLRTLISSTGTVRIRTPLLQHRSISPSRRAHSRKPAAASLLLCAMLGQTDGRTDRRRTDGPCSAYYAGSANNRLLLDPLRWKQSISMSMNVCMSLYRFVCSLAFPISGLHIQTSILYILPSKPDVCRPTWILKCRPID